MTPCSTRKCRHFLSPEADCFSACFLRPLNFELDGGQNDSTQANVALTLARARVKHKGCKAKRERVQCDP